MRITSITDELETISSTLKDCMVRNPDIIITSGGLGPTHDDMTLKGVGTALNRELKLDNHAYNSIKKAYDNAYKRGILKLVEKYGIDTFETHKKYLFNSTNKMMKAEIRTIPNGTYNGEAAVYYDGKTPGSKYKIRVKIVVKDEDITFDYSATDSQTSGFVNGTYTSSASATILTFLQMVNPDIPHNDGMIRPIKIIIPEGTILNAKYPAATTFGNHLSKAFRSDQRLLKTCQTRMACGSSEPITNFQLSNKRINLLYHFGDPFAGRKNNDSFHVLFLLPFRF